MIELKKVFTVEEPEEDKAAFFDIVSCENGRETVVGSCSLRTSSGEEGGNVGYFVQEEFRGRGYAEEAGRQLLFLAKRWEMQRVHIACETGNPASEAVARALGGVKTGTVQVHMDGSHNNTALREAVLYTVDL